MVKTYYEQLGLETTVTDEEIQERYDELNSNYDEEIFDAQFNPLYTLLHNRSVYDQIIKESSDVISRYHKYYESESDDNVKELVNIVEKCNNPIPELFDTIGNLFLDASDYDNSKKYYALYLNEHPDDSYVQFKMKNNSYADPDVIKKVLDTYKGLTKEEKENPFIIQSIANELRGLEQKEKAKEILLDEISSSPKDDTFNYSFLTILLATHLHKDGECEKAELFISEIYNGLLKKKLSAVSNIHNGVLLEEAGLTEWAEKFENLQEQQMMELKKLSKGVMIKSIIGIIVSIIFVVVAVFFL